MFGLTSRGHRTGQVKVLPGPSHAFRSSMASLRIQFAIQSMEVATMRPANQMTAMIEHAVTSMDGEMVTASVLEKASVMERLAETE